MDVEHQRHNGLVGIVEHPWRLAIPVILGVVFALGDDVVMMGGRLYPTRPLLYAKMLVFIAFFTVVFVLVERLIRMLAEREQANTRSSIWFRWSPQSILLGAAVILICWLPYLIVQYPGVYWSDTSRQLVMYYGGEPIMDQHPFFDTYVFGWFADLGQLLFSDRILGLYLLIILQTIAVTVLLSATVSDMRRIGAPRWLCIVMYAVMALFPLFPVMFSSLAKETINAIVVIPFIMMVAEIVRTEGACLKRPWFTVVLAADTLLICLTKKTGVYIVIITLLALCALRLGAKLRAMLIGIATALAVIMMAVIPYVVFPALDIQPGGKQEMVPVIAQQLAHDLKDHGDEFTEEDRTIIDGFFEYDSTAMAQRYDPFQADAVKGMYARDESSLTDVLGLWLRKTLEYPLGHLEAWLATSHGWISFRGPSGAPGYLIPYFASNWYTEQVTDYMTWPQETVRNHAVQTVYETVQGLPLVNSLFFRATWATVVPAFLCYLACGLPRGSRRNAWMVLAPLLMSTATLFIAGVSGEGGEPTRYVFTSILLAPMTMAFVATSVTGTIVNKKSYQRS